MAMKEQCKDLLRNLRAAIIEYEAAKEEYDRANARMGSAQSVLTNAQTAITDLVKEQIEREASE